MRLGAFIMVMDALAQSWRSDVVVPLISYFTHHGFNYLLYEGFQVFTSSLDLGLSWAVALTWLSVSPLGCLTSSFKLTCPKQNPYPSSFSHLPLQTCSPFSVPVPVDSILGHKPRVILHLPFPLSHISHKALFTLPPKNVSLQSTSFRLHPPCSHDCPLSPGLPH